ncbi:MAG: hypothetical protein ABUS49_01360 [Acidobacteriota bacterium]
MPRSKTGSITLEEAKARFEEWRRNRKGKASIPDELWASAVEVARREGVSRTSTELSVEWNHLKRRMAAASVAKPKAVPPAFVELVAPVEALLPECTIELEGRRGKLRIQLKGASASYLATLSREMWESAS